LIVLQLAAGLIYLLMGGDLLVRGAVALARRARISPMIVALTVVAFGTSLPELVVAVQAAWTGYPDLVLGNVVGSNIANVMLVGGGAAMIYPLPTDGAKLGRDSMIMLIATLLFFGFALHNGLSTVDGGLLLLGMGIAFMITLREASRAHRGADITSPIEWVLGLPSKLGMISIFLVLGAVGLPLGAKMVVDAAVQIAAEFGISEAVVGLTIVAVSTSLPELATTLIAAFQKRTEVAVGTIIGSNVLNILLIMAIAALVAPSGIPVASGFVKLDMPVMLAATLILASFVWRRRPVSRAAGTGLCVAYFIYIGWAFIQA